jgi:uncharacterized membrane protein
VAAGKGVGAFVGASVGLVAWCFVVIMITNKTNPVYAVGIVLPVGAAATVAWRLRRRALTEAVCLFSGALAAGVYMTSLVFLVSQLSSFD